MLTVFFATLGALENGRMPKFLAYGELVLHSPPVLLPRTARLYAKLASELRQAPAFLAYRVLLLHSSPVLYAPLPKLASELGQVHAFLAYREQILHSPPVLPASLQRKLGSNSVGIAHFTQNWLVDWGKRLHSLPTENRFCIRLQFCLRVCVAKLVDYTTDEKFY